MKRFLKREWESLEIPPPVLERSREEAWNRLRKPRHGISLWWPAAAMAAAALLLAVLRLAPPPDPVPPGPRIGQQSRPSSAVSPAAARPVVTAQEAGSENRPVDRAETPTGGHPTADRAAAPAPRESVSVPAPSDPAPAERVGRVVLHFQLPESGVRLIWVKDENFSFGGE